MRRFTSIQVHIAHFGHNTEISLQDTPRLKYTLKLFVGNEEKDLQKEDDLTWTPAQRPYAPCFLTM